MKKPALLFSLKCAVILYFAACTNIDRITVARTVSQAVTAGNWKIQHYAAADKDHTKTFSDYELTFNDGGTVLIKTNGKCFEGNWYEDNIKKTLVLNIGSNDKNVQQLNANWNITGVSDNVIAFDNNDSQASESMSIGKQ
ncbi:MAG: hypothetical protein ABJA78_01835 [Ferruginibacter sp.]